MSVRQLLTEFVKQHLFEQVRKKFDMVLPDDLKELAALFKSSGHQLYVVGGSVRDALQGKEPKDYDVATDAVPDQVIKVLRTNPTYKILEIGKSFGVVVCITPEGGEYEIATFRRDVGKGRRPDSVEFTSIEQDVMRRDLTINALFYDIDKHEVVDFVGGIDDIEKGVVKAVGDASERFDEDRLRILRALRFAGRMGSKLDPSTDAAIKKDNKLTGVSPERIRDEFLKGIKSARSVPYFLSLIDEYGLWGQLFPGLNASGKGIDTNNVPIALALMLDKNDAQTVAKKLNTSKYSADEVSQVRFLLMSKDIKVENAFRMKKQFKTAHLSDDDLIEYGHARGAPPSNVLMAFVEYEPTTTGAELMADGFTGAELGRELERRETVKFQELLEGTA